MERHCHNQSGFAAEWLSSWGCVGGSRDSASKQKGGGFVVMWLFVFFKHELI